MRARRAVAAATVLPVAAVLAMQAPAIATAQPCAAQSAMVPRPCELTVEGGEGSWHPDHVFALSWRYPPAEGRPPVVAVHYRALGLSGQVVLAPRTIWEPVQTIARLQVPAVPGVYTAEVWLEDANGSLGPPAGAKLRFDDLRPPAPVAAWTSEWIGAASFPFPVRLALAGASRPLSGIRGYAFSVDRDPDGDPCAAQHRCTETETDLRGAGEDTLWLARQPDGESHLHIAAVSGSGMKSRVAHTRLRVDATPPLTSLSGAPAGWTNRPVALFATASDAASGMQPLAGAAPPFTAIQVDGEAPVTAAGASVQAILAAPGIHSVAHFARDAAGNVADGGSVGGNPNPPATTTTVRIDTDRPWVAFANAQDPRDPEAIEAIVRDPHSGPDRSRGQIAIRPAGSRERFEPLSTEATAGRLRARWDSHAYPPGRYEFRAVGYDGAGNDEATTARADGSRMVLVAPLKASTSLTLRMAAPASAWPAPALVSSGRAVTVRGRLLAGRSAPLGSAQVRLIERFDSGSAPAERESLLLTDEGGRFSLRLPSGPSRTVLAVFAGTRTLARSESEPARLDVRGRVRMRASARVARVGGEPVVFAGSVASAGATLPAEGKHVQLQFRLPKMGWKTFRTLRTDRRGRFRYAYRFSDDDSRGVRFEFRAYAPAQSGWPYEPAGSRAVAVRGS